MLLESEATRINRRHATIFCGFLCGNVVTWLQQLRRHRDQLPYVLNPIRCGKSKKAQVLMQCNQDRDSCLQNVDVDVILGQMHVSASGYYQIPEKLQQKQQKKYRTTEPRMNIDVTESK